MATVLRYVVDAGDGPLYGVAPVGGFFRYGAPSTGGILGRPVYYGGTAPTVWSP